MLFLDPEIPDLWLHVARRDTGSLSQVEAVEDRLSAACEAAGLHVAFHATDGDRTVDKRHTKAFHLYASAVGTSSLEEIVDHLEHGVEGGARVVFHRFPVSDWLHLVKNLRQRIRNHTLQMTPGAPELNAATFEHLVRPAVVSVPGQAGAMNDKLAKELLTPDVLAAAFEGGNWTAPIFVAPWTFLASAMDSDSMSREAKLEAISIAFAMFSRIYVGLGEVATQAKTEAARTTGETQAQMKAEKAARDAAPKERGGADVVLTISDRNHLRRAMNLCVGLFYIIKRMPGALLLGRFGTHSIESHFGIVRSALRGQGQWRYWLGAEAYASIVVRMKEVLGLRTRGRAGRIPISGGIVAAMGEEDETAITPLPWTASGSGERRELLAAASRSVEGDLDGLSALYEYTLALLEHLKERPIRVDSDPSPQAGMVSAGRYSHPAPVWAGT